MSPAAESQPLSPEFRLVAFHILEPSCPTRLWHVCGVAAEENFLAGIFRRRQRWDLTDGRRANTWQGRARRWCLLINPGQSLSGRQAEVIRVQAALTSPSSLELNLFKTVQLLSIKELGAGHES